MYFICLRMRSDVRSRYIEEDMIWRRDEIFSLSSLTAWWYMCTNAYSHTDAIPHTHAFIPRGEETADGAIGSKQSVYFEKARERKASPSTINLSFVTSRHVRRDGVSSAFRLTWWCCADRGFQPVRHHPVLSSSIWCTMMILRCRKMSKILRLLPYMFYFACAPQHYIRHFFGYGTRTRNARTFYYLPHHLLLSSMISHFLWCLSSTRDIWYRIDYFLAFHQGFLDTLDSLSNYYTPEASEMSRHALNAFTLNRLRVDDIGIYWSHLLSNMLPSTFRLPPPSLYIQKASSKLSSVLLPIKS